MNKFKISGVGLDTTHIKKMLYSGDMDNFGYIYTTPKAGNESYLKPALSDSNILVTEVDFLDQLETVIPRHLSELGRSKIDLLLISGDCVIEDYVNTLNNLIISGQVDEVGISNPKSLQRLTELKDRISQLSHVSLNICPLNFDWSIIKYCQENNIGILGFNPFGGRFNYSRLIGSFTVPYLLSFSGAYSDVVFLSASRQDILQEETDYLLDLIDKEYENEYIITQDTHKLLKDPKQAIYTSLKISDTINIPFDSGDQIFSYSELVFKFSQQIYTTPTNEDDELEMIVREFYNNFSGGPEDNPTIQNTATLLRYRLLDLARLEYSEIDGWSIFCNPLDPQTFVISGVRKIIEKKFLKSKEITEQINYIAHYDGKNLAFANLKNALNLDSEP